MSFPSPQPIPASIALRPAQLASAVQISSRNFRRDPHFEET
jgi:hypothetical protein